MSGFYNNIDRIQTCDICDMPTGRCQDDSLFIEKTIHCEECFYKSKLLWGDCLELMDYIYDESIDLILCDLPYGVTKNKWDSIIDLEKLWQHYERIIKPNGAIILFRQDKFSARLMLSNEKLHRYNLVWEKTTPTGHLNAKKMPLRSHEDILIFYKKLPTYNPQKTTGHERKVSTAHHKRDSKRTTNYGKHGLTTYDSTERYPKSVLKFSTDKQKGVFHPTQKPVELCKYLIKTFSNTGDIVLDNCAGSGTTGVACLETDRRFILIEKEGDMIKVIKKRMGDYNKLFYNGTLIDLEENINKK
jgi:DNA modification methylase